MGYSHFKVVLSVNKGVMLHNIREKSSNKRTKSGGNVEMISNKESKLGGNRAKSCKIGIKLCGKGTKLTDFGAKITNFGAKITNFGAKSVIKAQKLADFDVFNFWITFLNNDK